MTKRYAPATERNRESILQVLREYLPELGTVLEIAAGTGQHAAFFSRPLEPRFWLPTDMGAASLASIASWREEAGSDNLLLPRELDVLDAIWPIEHALPAPISAVVNINMVHISPWECCTALFSGAARLLPSHGVVILYGPFKREGRHTAASNARFDSQLRSENPEWGIRDLDAVTNAAITCGFERRAVIEMPANNLSVVFGLNEVEPCNTAKSSSHGTRKGSEAV